METSGIRILVVDDFELFRRFIPAALSNHPKLHIVAEVSDGLAAFQKAAELRPDLIRLDIGLPKLNGIEAARRIRELSPSPKILFVSQQSSLDLVQAALDTGATGYVLKQDAGSQLLTAVNAVLDGQTFVSRSFADRGSLYFRGSQSQDDIGASGLMRALTVELNDSDDFHILLEEVLDTASSSTQADLWKHPVA